MKGVCQMPRKPTKVFDIIFDFDESDDRIRDVDVTMWSSPKQACDTLRRCIEKKRFYGVEVYRRRGAVFLRKI
jgi:hypothetical protein